MGTLSTAALAEHPRSCRTCANRTPGGLDDVPTICWDCSASEQRTRYHPHWTPITVERRIISDTPPTPASPQKALGIANAQAAQLQANPIMVVPPAPINTPAKAVDKQVGGGHYKDLGIQPIEYIHANSLNFFEGSAVKYITRWRQKGGVQDLRKAIHFLELQIELDGLK